MVYPRFESNSSPSKVHALSIYHTASIKRKDNRKKSKSRKKCGWYIQNLEKEGWVCPLEFTEGNSKWWGRQKANRWRQVAGWGKRLSFVGSSNKKFQCNRVILGDVLRRLIYPQDIRKMSHGTKGNRLKLEAQQSIIGNCWHHSGFTVPGTSLVVQWLRLRISNAGEVGLIPGQGPKTPYDT